MANFDQSVSKSLARNNIVIAADGSITVAGEYTLPILDGTNGQVMSTNGAGVISFTTASGSGDMTAAVYDPSGIVEQLVGLTATQTLTNKSGSNNQWTNDAGYTTNVGTVTPSTTDTFTNKTFDANATGNSLSNVDIADLANGTDGELITWDASAAPTTVAAGTTGQILTSNGAGAAPTFEDAGGGGSTISAASFYDNVGGQVIGTTDTTVSLLTTQRNNDTGIFTASASVITIATTGDYYMSWEVSCNNNGGTRGAIESHLQVDTGGGFANVPGTLSKAYHRTSTDGCTAAGSALIAVVSGNKYKLVVSNSNVSAITIAQGSRLTFMKM